MSVIRPDTVSRQPEPPRAAPPSKRHDPAAVISFPTTSAPDQRRQETAQRRHSEDPRSFKARLPALVGHLHALGIRPVAELLIEHVGDDEQARDTLLLLLEKYGRLNPAVVQAVGGDTFPPAIFAVAGDAA